MRMSQNLPEHVARSVLARATELDARTPTVSIDELRAIATELNVSSASLEAALREHDDAVLEPARTTTRGPLFVTALGLPLGTIAGAVLSTAHWFSAVPLASIVAGCAFLSSAALIVLHSKRPSLRSFIAHNTTLWGGVVAGSLAAIAVLGIGTASEVPWLVMIVSGVRNWITSTVLGSAAVIAMRRANIRKRENPEVRSTMSEPSASERSPSFLNRMLGWLNVTRRNEPYQVWFRPAERDALRRSRLMCLVAVPVLVMLPACAIARHNDTATAGREIFRSVQFDPYNPIMLGEVLSPGSPPVAARGRLHALADLRFGGTDTIYVELGPDSLVKAMHFVYHAAELDERLNSYEQSLGAPQSRTEADSATGRVNHVTWEDSATRFVFGHYVSRSGERRVSSSLIDKGNRQ